MEWPVMILLCSVVWIVVFGYLGAWVAVQCGRDSTEGFLLGVLLGAFGVLIECLLPHWPDEPD